MGGVGCSATPFNFVFVSAGALFFCEHRREPRLLQIHKLSQIQRSKNPAEKPRRTPTLLRINTDDRLAIPMLPSIGFAHERTQIKFDAVTAHPALTIRSYRPPTRKFLIGNYFDGSGLMIQTGEMMETSA